MAINGRSSWTAWNSQPGPAAARRRARLADRGLRHLGHFLVAGVGRLRPFGYIFQQIARLSAQVFTIAQNEKYHEKQLSERLLDHALFISFAPADDPKLAVAVFVENGKHGGSTAAPIARKMFDAYLLSDKAPTDKAPTLGKGL